MKHQRHFFTKGPNLGRAKSPLSFATKILAALSLVMLSACTPTKEKWNDLKSDLAGIFSVRPQTATHALLLVKLKQKPLLATAAAVNGQKKVDEQLAQSIDTEQEDFIKAAQAISSEVKVIYRYRMVINGIAFMAPLSVVEKLRGLGNIAYIEKSGSFTRPVIRHDEEKPVQIYKNLVTRNSAKFIGADQAHAKGIRGQGMRVGIIDTGIDYTHAMLGGVGTEEAYKSVDPAQPTAQFPNAKVVGGVDLVGTNYDSAGANLQNRFPIPDMNPIDEAGHGTHVAGTVAGIGDGVNTYDGVAPDALLYSLKVFGKDGSTGDAVVIAALEYAADPDSNRQLGDQLDVVNLSLGSSYGEGHILYSEAIYNLSQAGTVVVCSAGNSGDSSYIVGAPSVADSAISVAASIDDMDHNWQFPAVKFSSIDHPELLAEAVESPIAKSIEEAGNVTGPLVYIGLADKELSDEVKAQLQGKIAFIDRGVVTFSEKIGRAAAAGAIGVVVANNQPGSAIAMGGDGEHQIPAVMIVKDLGEILKADLAKGDVVMEFQTSQKIEKPQLIDTITDFSSKGPRSQDSLLKPEIAAPGSQVVSADVGGGAKGVAMSGTSMAAPHMAGVMALLKQVHPTLSTDELKSLTMGTAKLIANAEKKPYPVSRQGAGRVQIIPALEGTLVSSPAGVSLGEITIEARKTLQRVIDLKNISTSDMSVGVSFVGHAALNATVPTQIDLKAGQSTSLTIRFVVDATSLTETTTELEGFLKFTKGDVEISHIPVLAVANKVSQINSESFVIHSTSRADSQGAIADLKLKNSGLNAGDVYLFNRLLGQDGRKEDASNDPFRSRSCDLEQAGYRVLTKDGKQTLQIAVKLYEPVTTWDGCEVSILIDGDGDGVADQELAGIKQDHLEGLTEETFASVLLDAPRAREIRKQFELDGAAGKPDLKQDYTSAVISKSSMMTFDHSTIAIVEVPVADLKLKATGELSLQVATSYLDMSAVEPDDFLQKNNATWSSISVGIEAGGFSGFPEKVSLAGSEAKVVALTKGASADKLLALYPQNKTVVGGLRSDLQAEVIHPKYESALEVAGK